jgi:DNA-binding CsgD family transcriptional regulator
MAQAIISAIYFVERFFMAIHIPNDHPTLALKSRINAVCKNFFADFNFSYFQYLRCYANGSVSLLTNNTGLFEHFKEIDNSPVIFSSYEEEHKKAASYWFLWDEELPEFPVDLARKKFNIFNGITLVRRTKHYYDMIAVALPYEQAHAGSFYLNKSAAIEQFIAEFDTGQKELIRIAEKNPIALPEAYRDKNYQEICLPHGKFTFKSRYNQDITISAQELSCLRLWVQGASYKEIANQLVLSPRTVETYLKRAREKTGFTSRPDLRRMLGNTTF